MDIQPVDDGVTPWRTLYTVRPAVGVGAALVVEAIFLTYGPLGSGIQLNDIKAHAARHLYATEERALLFALISIVAATILSEAFAWAGASRRVAFLPWVLPAICMVAAALLEFPARQHWVSYLANWSTSQ